MSQGTQGAAQIRLGRDLARTEAILLPIEALMCGVPCWLLMSGVLRPTLWLKIVVPLTVALLGAVTAYLADRLGPVRVALAAHAAGARTRSLDGEKAGRLLQRAPRESAVAHFLLWVLLGLCLAAFRARACPLWTCGGLLQLIVLSSGATAALRLLTLERLLAGARPVVSPELQPMQVFSVRYRGWLGAAALVGFGVTTAVLALGVRTVMHWPGPSAHLAGLILVGTGVLGGVLWWRRLNVWAQPLEQYFNVTVRAPGTKGPARDEPKAVGAFAAAQCLPYRLALLQVGVWATGGLAGLLIANRGEYPLGPLLAMLGLAALGALLFQTIMAQQVLRALIRHVGSRHAVPPAEVRSPLGLGRKLRLSMVAFVVIGSGTCLLFAMAPGRGPGAWLWLAANLLSLVLLVVLVVRDVVAPLHALEERSSEMGSGQLARPVPAWGEADEIGRLAMVFEQMRRSLRDRLRSTESINVDLEREVRRRTEALEQRNADLREALEKLRRAQDNLVRSEKLASMGRLVAGIAHEINNPVNAVINSLGPLEETIGQMAATCGSGDLAKTVGEAQEILAVVQRGAARTKAIVQALHGYARGDETVERDVSLARSVDETLGLLAHRLRHVKIEKEVDPGARIRGFPGQIDQVLMNLLTNAAQAMGSTGGTIRIATSKRDAHIVLAVSDTGPGIPADVLPRIFDPFFTTKDVGEGSGLGLSIVHGIIERHRGQIEVDSKPGQGTTFTILFPKPAPAAPV